MNILNRFKYWWFFKVRNAKVRQGESGGFKWLFRRYSMEISSLSGNFRVFLTADKHPYGMLLSDRGDDNICGYSEIIYTLCKLLTTDQQLANDVVKAITDYRGRLETVLEDMDEDEDKIALEEVRQVQEVVEMPKKERKKYRKDVDRRFKKAVKKSEQQESE